MFFYSIKEDKVENREKFEIPTIAFTEVTMLAGNNSTCSGECTEHDPSKPIVLAEQNFD